MKKLLALMLALAMMLSLAACGSSSSSSSSSSSTSESTEAAETEEAAEEEEEAEEAEEEEVSTDDGTVYQLRMSSSQTTGTWQATLLDEYAQDIYEATNGRVEITIYHDDALGTPTDTFTMLTQGGLDILNCGIGQIGTFYITDIVQTPFLLTSPYTAGEVMYQLLEEDKLPEFTDNMHVLIFMPTDMQMIALVDDEVTSLSDFSGLKIRANSGQLISAIECFGASAVSITTTEVFLSLSQGVIDGGISSPNAMVAFSWQDAVNYLLDLPISTGVNFIGVNLDVWDSLPSDLQEIMDEVSMELYDKYMVQNEEEMQNSINTMLDAGVQMIEPSDEFVEEIKEATSFLLDDLAESLTELGFDGEGLVAEAREIVANSQYEN